MHDSDSRHRLKVVALLDAALSLSLVLIAATKGQKLKPVLTEMTGLSDTRIGQGNLGKLSQSTQRRVERHIRKHAIDEGRRNGMTVEQVDANIAELQALKLGPWEVFALILMARDIDKIPHSLVVARAYGQHLSALLADVEAQRFDEFRARISPQSLKEVALHREHLAPEKLDRYCLAFDGAHDWEALQPLVDAVVDLWIWDLFAAMDAEWGQNYFAVMAPQPYFLWVAPKTPLAIQEKMEIKSSRNIVHHPVRRLLELSHALMVYGNLRRWPDQPVGRREFGRDTDTDETLVGNYFDGTKVLRVKDFEHLWHQMHIRLPSRTTNPERPTEPMALVHAALLYQRLLVRAGSTKRSKSFVIVDEIVYRASWKWHLGVVAGQPKANALDWPEWLVSQRLSPPADSIQRA